MRGRGEPSGSDRLQGRVTNGATRARLRLRNPDCFADPGRARVEQNRVSAGMKIFLRPGDVLAALFAGAAVTTGGLATD